MGGKSQAKLDRVRQCDLERRRIIRQNKDRLDDERISLRIRTMHLSIRLRRRQERADVDQALAQALPRQRSGVEEQDS
jgi:hypothetical protein